MAEIRLQSLMEQAVGAYAQGRSARAARLCREALRTHPSAFAPLYLLGVVRHQQGDSEEALALIARALQASPEAAEAHNAKGMVLQSLGRDAQALASFDQALAAKPDFAEALFNRGVGLGRLGRSEAALDSYDRALALQPGHAGVLYNRGVVLGDLGRHVEALISFDRALASAPGFASAWNNRGFTLQQIGRHEAALESFDQAVAADPDLAAAWLNRGVALKDLGRTEDALASFERAVTLDGGLVQGWSGRAFVLQRLGRLGQALLSAERALAFSPDDPEALLNRAAILCEGDRLEAAFADFRRYAALTSQSQGEIPAHRARHEREQGEYLLACASQDQVGRRLTGSAINPSAGIPADAWPRARPKVVVVDDLLTPEALDGLRRYCLAAPVWKQTHEGGYLGAMPEHGFACPLLAQIAEELRQSFPDILADHPLRYLWAFKYDARLQGIAVHADRAAVNVNFWITPDEANLDPASGGMAVWDVAAPLDWDFEAYNADPAAIRAFLAQAGAKKTTIPYRANRAVIFDSDLFHETDEMAFKEGYLNRRINVTLLYGRRSLENR